MYIKAEIERIPDFGEPPEVYQMYTIPEITINEKSVEVLYHRVVEIRVYEGLEFSELLRRWFCTYRIFRKYRETHKICAMWDGSKFVDAFGRSIKLDLTDYAHAKNDKVRAYVVGKCINRLAGHETAPFPYNNREFIDWMKNNIG